MTVRVLLNGAAGKMGRAMGAGILADPELELAGAVDRLDLGADCGELMQGKPCGVTVQAELAAAIRSVRPDVLLDFTAPHTVRENLLTALQLDLPCVVGTTGLSEADLAELDALARAHRVGVLIAPNFALSAVLMARFAAEAVRYFPDYELVESHHDRKLDAPSGTALYMAKMMSANRTPHLQGRADSFEYIDGCRGGDYEGARIHSQRLPGVVARHEITFGGPGQLLYLKQEATSRDAFWPGVRLALLKVQSLKGVHLGLEKVL